MPLLCVPALLHCYIVPYYQLLMCRNLKPYRQNMYRCCHWIIAVNRAVLHNLTHRL